MTDNERLLCDYAETALHQLMVGVNWHEVDELAERAWNIAEAMYRRQMKSSCLATARSIHDNTGAILTREDEG